MEIQFFPTLFVEVTKPYVVLVSWLKINSLYTQVYFGALYSLTYGNTILSWLLLSYGMFWTHFLCIFKWRILDCSHMHLIHCFYLSIFFGICPPPCGYNLFSLLKHRFLKYSFRWDYANLFYSSFLNFVLFMQNLNQISCFSVSCTLSDLEVQRGTCERQASLVF